MPRQYSRRQKATAVALAEVTSQTQAAAAAGIPLSTLHRWMDEPWAADLRTKTRGDIADEARVAALLALQEIVRQIRSGSLEGRDAVIAFGVLIDKAQLLSGEATARTESRTLTDGLNDHEKATLRDAIDTFLAAHPDPASDPV